MMLWLKRGFVHLLWSVSNLESYLNQNLISSFPCMMDHFCKRKLNYVYQFLRHFDTSQTHRHTGTPTNRQAKTLYPALRQAGDKYDCKVCCRISIVTYVFFQSVLSNISGFITSAFIMYSLLCTNNDDLFYVQLLSTTIFLSGLSTVVQCALGVR